jgi:hypothetical protein
MGPYCDMKCVAHGHIEYPAHVIQQELDVPPVRPPSAYRLVNQSAGGAEIAEAVKLARAAKSPILLVGHGVHTSRAHEPVAERWIRFQCAVRWLQEEWQRARVGRVWLSRIPGGQVDAGLRASSVIRCHAAQRLTRN